jgi:hypothetical protein
VPQASPDFRPNIPLSAIPGSEFETQQSQLPDARVSSVFPQVLLTMHMYF